MSNLVEISCKHASIYTKAILVTKFVIFQNPRWLRLLKMAIGSPKYAKKNAIYINLGLKL